jgi:hypothetical protein
LTGLTLSPGLYQTSPGGTLALNGNVTLDGGTDPNPAFIFQVGSALNINSGTVILAGTAKAINVFWQVGTSCTIGPDASMVGIIMADQSITYDLGATLLGRALAHVAAVTLDTNNITNP